MANAYEGTLGLCLYNGCCKDLWALEQIILSLAYYQSRIIARLNDTLAICGKVLRIHEAVIMRQSVLEQCTHIRLNIAVDQLQRVHYMCR